MRWMALVAVLWTGTASADAPVVVADIPPVHSLVARVMAGVGEPVLLLDGSASPHGGSLRPSQARALAGADLVVWTGAALTPWLGDAIPGGGLALLDAEGTYRLDLRKGGDLRVGEGHGHDHAHAHDDPVDPHAWLDPVNGRVWLGVIAAELSRIDAENAPRYVANAAEGIEEIAALQARIETLLSPYRERDIAVAHDAFHYFEDRFELRAVNALTAGDTDAAGPRRVRDSRARLSQGDIRCLLTEPGARTADRIAKGTPVEVVRLDPLGVKLEKGRALYGTLLHGMAKQIAACLGSS